MDSSALGAVQLAAFRESFRDVDRELRPITRIAEQLARDASQSEALARQIQIIQSQLSGQAAAALREATRQAIVPGAFTEAAKAATAFTSATEQLRKAFAESTAAVATSALVAPIQDVTRAYVGLSKILDAWPQLSEPLISQKHLAAQFKAVGAEASAAIRRQLRDMQSLTAAPASVQRDVRSLHTHVEGSIPDALLRANKIAFVAEETRVADTDDG